MPKNIGFAGEKQSDLAKNGLERAINRFKRAKNSAFGPKKT